MKTQPTRLLAFFAAIAVFVTTAISTIAQSTPSQRKRGTDDRPDRSQRGGGNRPDPIFVALDADRDGSLSKAELQNAAAVLRKLDKNNDGKLTQDELGGDRRGGGKGKGGGRGKGKGEGDKQRRDNPAKGNRDQ